MRILLAGYYGFDNAGDEAVLAGLIKAFRTRAGGDELFLAAHSIAPEVTTKCHGIPAFHRYRPGPLIKSLAETDLFALGGGSLLQDATSARSIYYYLAVTRIAQILGKKTMFIGQGIGPLGLPRSRSLTRAVANRLTAITVRDQGSADLLAAIGVAKPPVTVTADPALLLADGSGAGERGGCAISFRQWRDKTPVIIDAFESAYNEKLRGVPLISMAMHAGSDDKLNHDIVQNLGGVGPSADAPSQTLPELLAIAAKAELVVGMRLHALIFAAAAQTPSVAISYDPKVTAFMVQTGQQDMVFDIASSPASLLGELIGRCWEERQARRAALAARLPPLRAAAQRNADIALEVLG